MIAQRRIIVHCIALGSAILLLGAPIAFDGPNANAAPSLPAPCVLGDGYKVKSGASIKVYPVRCPTNCFDAPNGGPIEKQLFCKDGTLGISDPTLTADGTVAPYEVASQYNGPGHCTALPSHPGWWDKWGQSADRKTCVKL